MIDLGSEPLIQHVHGGGEQHTLVSLTGTPSFDASKIMGFEHFVDLIGNCVPVADVLEVGRIEIDRHDLAPLVLRLRCDEPPTSLANS